MRTLCFEIGCHRPLGHVDPTHEHLRFPMGRRGALEQPERERWPNNRSIVVLKQRGPGSRDPNRRR